eukprot:Nk52_evm2s116 gene=Nk52_evmTU2s116
MQVFRVSTTSPLYIFWRRHNKNIIVLLFFTALFFYNWVLGVLWYFVSDCRADPVYQQQVSVIASETARVLESKNVLYWMDMGTLLGAMRDHKMIAHDTDVDFAYHKKDWSEVELALNDHDWLVLRMQNYEGRKLARIYDRRVGPINTQYPHIDLFAYWPVNERGEEVKPHIATHYAQLVDEMLIPKEIIGDVTKKRAMFEGREFYAPERTIQYLNIRYGSDWATTVKRRWQDCKNAVTIWMWGVKV